MEAKIIKVEKSEFEIFKFGGGYYGICKTGTHGGECVLGGDSANEDDYNEEYINEEYDNWDGTLYCTGEDYGYRIHE